VWQRERKRKTWWWSVAKRKEREDWVMMSSFSFLFDSLHHLVFLWKTLKIFWITLNQDLSLRYPPSKLDFSTKINRLEEGHNSYPLVCRRPAATVFLQTRQICYRWGTPAYWTLVLRSSMFSLRYPPSKLDFSTLYTNLLHDKLKSRLKETIHKAFSHRNYGSNFVVLG
jgi:hypothetical protein